jgi:rubrerythrin
MEQEAGTYYEKLAASISVAELKNIFTLLAAAEREHLAALQKMKDNVAPAKADFPDLGEAACAFKPLLGKRNLMAELADDPDAYGHVVKEEEESIKFYEDLAAKAEDGATRRLLLDLIEQERKHLSIVENIYAFVESPKTYLAWGEFSNLQEF